MTGLTVAAAVGVELPKDLGVCFRAAQGRGVRTGHNARVSFSSLLHQARRVGLSGCANPKNLKVEWNRYITLPYRFALVLWSQQ